MTDINLLTNDLRMICDRHNVSISPLTDDMFIGYKDGDFTVTGVNFDGRDYMSETNNGGKRHYIADESLGGIEREYIEVGRKAGVGDYVHISKYAGDFEDGIALIDRLDEYNDYIAYGHPFTTEGDRYDLDPQAPDEDVYTALSPTNIVRLPNGERFELHDRKAEVGEKVVHTYEGKSDGIVTEVLGSGVASIDVHYFVENGKVVGIKHGGYSVLVPVAAAKPVEISEESPVIHESPQSSEDLIANLARRVHELERRLDDVSGELAGLDDVVDSKSDLLLTTADGVNELLDSAISLHGITQSLADDFETLDERTQPEAIAAALAELLAKQSRGRGVRE